MTLSHRIREAALGPTPVPYSQLLADWIGSRAVADVAKHLGMLWCSNEFPYSRSVTVKRMFLLFVAEALEGEA